MTELVRTPDGRSLAVESYGDPEGRPVLVLMGTPNSRLLYGPTVADAAARGLRLVSYDRPGYGGSTPQPDRSVADATGDVSAICEALDIAELVVWGISGGGTARARVRSAVAAAREGRRIARRAGAVRC